ncbi:MAG TPA: thiamine-phosphate kinase [Candidatus Nanopelagicaceae bacterium]
MKFSESEVIAELTHIFARPDSRVYVGIGDDAAVLAPSMQNWVVTTDMAVEGVHFRREWSSGYEIGRKITAANLADIYAMGGIPHHLVIALALTGDESMAWIRELASGMNDEAGSCDATIVGGDIARGPVVVISVTAIGQIQKPILRSGAQVGDQIVISDLPGWSAAGLYLLLHEINISAVKSPLAVERALAEFRAPDVRYADAIALSSAHALSDISDGLLVQGAQMADASGVRFVIDSKKIESHPDFPQLAELAEEVGAYVWDWIGAGGEDHDFLATGRNLPGLVIGQVHAGSGIELQGIPKTPKGFEHFT